MSTHSRVVGGSIAARVLNCPGSAALIARLPEAVDQPSIYATEGSACHTVIAELIAGESRIENQIGRVVQPDVGHEGEPPIVITQELLHDCIEPAFSYYRHLREALGDGCTGMVEETCAFPGIVGAFGTVDVVIHDPRGKRTFILDWKFGSGVPVYASYPDPDDPRYEIVNPQLMFYACAARASFPALFPEGGKVVLTIYQPRMREARDRTTIAQVTHEELDLFTEDMIAAVAEQAKPQAPMKLGSWCRFAPCRSICPLHLAPIVDLTRLRPILKDPEFKDLILEILEMAAEAETVIVEARRQAHALIEAGTPLPGWKLVPKRGTRKWIVDAPALVAVMKQFKIRRTQLYETKLMTPARVEDLLPKGTRLPEGLTTVVSSGTTLARDEDARVAIPTIGAVAKLLAGLKRAS